MSEPREARVLIESAEQAAAAGNYASAEDLLREAAARQEQTLGPHHPDLANTLNNLGIVCEMTDNPIDAEHYFRRAHTIATATLAPDHPFVLTSRKNLHDFCAARGRLVELPPSPPAVAAWLDAPARPVAPPPRRSATTNTLALGAVSGVALLLVTLTMTRPWGTPVEGTLSPAAAALPPAPAAEAPEPTPTPEPITRPQPSARPAQPTRREGDATSASPATPVTPSAMPTVVTAQLCSALSAWRCEPATREASRGTMFFYTQLRSATATTIEHRWYQDDRLRQAVPLRIQANPGAGYRTYSRTIINSERAGDWRVEVRSADGSLLHEERFTVR